MGISRDAQVLLAKRELERRECSQHPAALLARAKCFDERTAEPFQFGLGDPSSGWYWQRELLDWWEANPRTVVLKARQLGVTWLAGGKVLHRLLYKPGSLCLVYRQKEEEAKEVVGRIWEMLHSLPRHLWNGAEVVTPSRGERPHTEIRLRFPDKRVSRLLGMTSVEASGHGKTAALILMDEFSRIDKAGEIMKAVQPAAGTKGEIIIVSTANGISGPQGDGNYFHYLWVNAEAAGFAKKFLGWRMHPERDDVWYASSPEIIGLRPWERAEQYPDNPVEAFTFTSRGYFDQDALSWYAQYGTRQPIFRCEFISRGADRARVHPVSTGMIRVYERPQAQTDYALGADVATGRGRDYSAAYVINLSTMAIAAELHAKIDANVYAFQLHYLGRWYNTARLAIEMGGGFGEPVVIFLRDGKDGRPAYPKLYRHTISDRSDLPIKKEYGYPINTRTRPLIIENFQKAIRERAVPYLTEDLLGEMGTFVDHDTLPSPRAAGGCFDDRVMACAIVLELYRQYGHHKHRLRKQPKKPQRIYPWQPELVRT